MQVSNYLQTIRNLYDAWEERDQEKLNLAADMKHISKLGSYHSKEDFLNACWGVDQFHNIKIDIKDTVEQGNKVAVWYDLNSTGGVTTISEWFTFNEAGEISEIRVFF